MHEIEQKQVKLKELAESVEHKFYGDENVTINGFEYDSRHVEKGNVFCCVSGTFADGHKFAEMAVENGAVALLCERKLDIDVPQVVVENTRKAMAVMSAKFEGEPAKKMQMVGITGTNGKTTSTYMIKEIAQANGKKVGIIGTIRNMIGDEIIETERTTPASNELQALLGQMHKKGVDIVVMEVSSHSLDQDRVYGIEFDVAEFTNLTQDHLDYHHTFENYYQAKKKLFFQTKKAVINCDDEYAGRLIREIRSESDIPILTYGEEEKQNAPDISCSDIKVEPIGVSYKMKVNDETRNVFVPIPGDFSMYNASGAIAVALSLGFSLDSAIESIRNMQGVSGRIEPLNTHGRNFTVLLDYAHTPDALENVLVTIRKFAKGRVVTLFGCGGDRDSKKRPIMGETAGDNSDFVIVTSDNPRSEKPLDIIEQVEDGVRKSGCEYCVIENRKEAIRYALENAQDNDVILLAGKGHETYQEINGVKHHFDEKEIVEEILSQMDNENK